MAAPSINSSRAMATIRREPGFRYCPAAMKSMQAAYRLHEKASRVSPARPRASRQGTSGIRTRGIRLGGRQQHGVDHVDDAVRLVDVGDRDHRGVALGVDDPG